MKRVIIVIALSLILSLSLVACAKEASADINGNQANRALFKIIKQIRNQAASTAVQQNVLKNDGNVVRTDHTATLDDTDEANVITLAGKINVLIAAAEDVRDYSETTWDLDL